MHGRETTTLWCYTFIASLQETNDSWWWLVLASEFPTQEMGALVYQCSLLGRPAHPGRALFRTPFRGPSMFG